MSVKALMKSDTLGIYTEATSEGFADECTMLGDRDRADESVFYGRVAPGTLVRPLAAMWPADAAEIEQYALTPEDAMAILYYMASKALNRSLITGVQVISTIVVAVVKRGTVSQQFLQKVSEGIKDDLNKVVTFNEEVIRLTYINYGQQINDVNIQVVFARWKSQIPAGALRLGLVVSQAAGGGLTAYLTIREAIKEYKDFDWGYISLCFPQEWAGFETAVQTVGGNQYYGFRKDLGDAKSTHFKSLAWVAKELLIKAGGKTSLSRYSGWVGLIAHQNAITDKIDAYVRGLAASITEEMVNEQRANPEYLATLEAIRN
ncbi:hypothetical protein JTB14_032449 [Gonioctena quinquepunctata]|nr:hypothetical protein JTB14_032449 [Gonioctena quinquepunctata]